MSKLYVHVIPNSWNAHGYCIQICKGWKFFQWEVGRVVTEDQLQQFLDTYTRVDGKVIEL